MKSDRQLALEISRIKAPKRRRANQQTKANGKSKVELPLTLGKTSPVSVVDKFQPLITEAACATVSTDLASSGFALKKQPLPVVIFGSDTSSFHQRVRNSAHVGTPAVQIGCNEILSDSNVSQTYDWLINAGVPVSAFDPVSVDCKSSSQSVDLYECADEITSMFSSRSESPTIEAMNYNAGSLDSPGGSVTFGFNDDDASLKIPQAMLGKLNAAIWGL